MKIFIIDDDELFTENLSSQLRDKNLDDIHTFHSLSSAIGKMHLEPEIIILDHFLHGTLGTDLIPIIKENHPKTKIIYISSQKKVNVLATARLIGATSYIKKDKDLLQNIVNEIHKKEDLNQLNSDSVFFKLKSLLKKPRKRTLFIVDDDELYSVFLRYKLSKTEDFEINMYKDGRSVMKDVEMAPDILILDYKLEEMTAETVLNEFKKNSPKTHVVILSSQENIDIALNLFELGIADYVVKNKNWEQNLLQAIDKFPQQRTKASVN